MIRRLEHALLAEEVGEMFRKERALNRREFVQLAAALGVSLAWGRLGSSVNHRLA